MALHKILVIDDEPLLRRYCEEILNRLGYEVCTAAHAQHAFQLLEKDQFDLVITDMKMPGMSGLDVIKKVKSLSTDTLVIVITDYGSIENVVQAMQLGAYHYLTKPFEPETLESILLKAGEHHQLRLENRYLRHQGLGSNSQARTSHHVIAKSPLMCDLLAQVEQIAQSRANVFISGESGTGKEVIAHAIHRLSPRAQAPFIRVNCAALPETLMESEFFGHEKGAFTGADNKREGRFELAHGGSLLLDEITEIPINLQAKLLRAVQEQEFERLGGKKTMKVDVRVISTSNRDLRQAIEEKKLREDLYYRLNVIPIHVPALRERPEDIQALAEHYLSKLCIENHKKPMKLSPSAMRRLTSYSWPGNVRELINVIERSVVLCNQPIIEESNLWIELSHNHSELRTLKEHESYLILETMRTMGHNKPQAAKALGITLKALEKKLQEIGFNQSLSQATSSSTS